MNIYYYCYYYIYYITISVPLLSLFLEVFKGHCDTLFMSFIHVECIIVPYHF